MSFYIVCVLVKYNYMQKDFLDLGSGGGTHLTKIYISVSYMFNRGKLCFQPKISKTNFTNLENNFYDNSRTRPAIL